MVDVVCAWYGKERFTRATDSNMALACAHMSSGWGHCLRFRPSPELIEAN